MTDTNGTNGTTGMPRRFPWRFVAISAAAIVLMFVIGYVIAVRVLFPPLPEPTNGIVVPALTGLTVPAAEARLRRLDLRVSDVVEIVHPTQPRGVIVAQSPLAGQQLRAAGAVRLAISSGAPHVAVPNVIGFAIDRATALLASVGLQVEQRTEPADRPAGTVIRVSPEPGVDIATPGRVVVYISSGPAPTVPDSSAPRPDTSTLPPDTLAVSASGTTT